MKLEEHISELLFDHDCVIVPEFGGFVCNYAPARIDPVKHLFDPPGKKILFNKGLIRNDGLLAHHISGKLKLPYSNVLFSIEKEVKRLREELRKDRRITLENIGLLYLDEKENLLFQQENKLNYLPESFGMSSFYHLPLSESHKPSAISHQLKPTPIYKERAKVRYYVAAAVIGALGLSTFWFALMEKGSNQKFSSLNIFSSKETSEYVFSAAKYNEIPKVVNEPFTIVAVNYSALNTSTIPESNKPVAVLSSSYYTIITGGFAEKEHADNMIAEYNKQNLHLSIVGRNAQGLYLVGFGKYLSHTDAANARDNFRKSYVKDAWIKAN